MQIGIRFYNNYQQGNRQRDFDEFAEKKIRRVRSAGATGHRFEAQGKQKIREGASHASESCRYRPPRSCHQSGD